MEINLNTLKLYQGYIKNLSLNLFYNFAYLDLTPGK